MENKWLSIILSILLSAGIIFCIIKFSVGEMTATESLLLSILLTFLSIVGSWLLSSIYSEYSFNKSLKTFALKASEKVNNLSNELNRLTVFLQQELENGDYKSNDEAILARDIKIESVIHILTTLKSVNDKSLSDWQGVIGDELIAQKEKQEEKEKDLREMIERVEALIEQKEEEYDDSTIQGESLIEGKIEDISKDLRLLSSQIVGLPFRRPRTSENSETIILHCPNCSALIKCKQKKLNKKMGALKCDACNTKLYFTNDEGNLSIKERLPIKEKICCPACSCDNIIEMDPFPGQVYNSKCIGCGVDMIICRKTVGINIELKSINQGLNIVDEEFINAVYKNMPAQPWPKGTAIDVAKKLNVELRFVQEAVNQLIKQGKFKYQINGELYDITKVS